MITWLQNSLQKHLKTIFIILLGIIIISFVFTIGAAPGIRGVESELPELKFYGVNLNSERDIRPYQEGAVLSSILDYGMPPFNQQQMTFLLVSRIYLLHVADQLQIPHPTKEMLTDFIKSKRVFHDEQGHFSKQIYDNFVEYLDSTPKLGRVVLALTLDQDYRIQLVRTILAGPGYVQKEEAVIMLQATHTEWSGILAKLDFSQFKPEIKATDEQLKEYFEQNKDRYTIDSKVTAELVIFAAEDYLHEVDMPSEEDLKEFFTVHKGQYADKDGKNPAFESVMEKVKTDFMLSQAKEYAAEAGNQLALRLFEDKIQHKSDEYKKLLQESGGKAKKVGPYGVADLQKLSGKYPAEGLMLGFSLTNEKYFSDVFFVKEGAALLVLDDKQEPREPKFEEVVNDVRRDYNESERNRLLADHIRSIDEQLKPIQTAAAFDAKAKELKLTLTSFDKLSLIQPNSPEDFPQPLFAYLSKLQANQISPVVRLGDAGYVIFLKDKKVPTVADVQGELEKSLAGFRAMSGSMELQGYISEAMVKLQGGK